MTPAEGGAVRALDAPVKVYLDPGRMGPRPSGADAEPGLFVTIGVYPPLPSGQTTAAQLRAINDPPPSVTSATDGVPRWFDPETSRICAVRSPNGCEDDARIPIVDHLSLSSDVPNRTQALDGFTFRVRFIEVNQEIECHRYDAGSSSGQGRVVVTQDQIPRTRSITIARYCSEHDVEDRNAWAMRQVAEALRALVSEAGPDLRVSGLEVVEAELNRDDVILRGWVY